MNAITWSPQQQDLFTWVKTGQGSAFVQAVAGAGKTTSCVEAARFMTGSVAMVVFNKRNAVEMTEKLGKAGLTHVRAGTFHSFGFAAWRKVHSGVKVDNFKIDNILKTVDDTTDEFIVPAQLHTFVKKLVSLARQRAIGLFGAVADTKLWWDIVEHFDLIEELEEPRDAEKGIEFAKSVLKISCDQASQVIDFDDMIYMPVVTGVKLWQNDWVIVDESQDTNPARRAMVRKMLKRNGRALFVGDEHQSIYGFTGADADAVAQIKTDFSCQELPLTVTYRCPKAVVALARTVVGHITAADTAPEGKVTTIEEKDLLAHNLTADDAIICRKTKPIVELAFQFIRKGIACHVEGRDIGAGLLNLVNRWKVKSIDALRNNLEKYLARETEKLVAKGREMQAEALADRVETLYVVMVGCEDVECVRAKIISLFQDGDGERKKTLTLSTIHKAKGREWNRVFNLGWNTYQPSKAAKQEWQKEQEQNTIYVAYTRAKCELFLVNAEVKPKQEEPMK